MIQKSGEKGRWIHNSSIGIVYHYSDIQGTIPSLSSDIRSVLHEMRRISIQTSLDRQTIWSTYPIAINLSNESYIYSDDFSYIFSYNNISIFDDKCITGS